MSLQEVRYMDPYATMYVITNDPNLTNKWGMKKTDQSRGKQTFNEIERPPHLDGNIFRLINLVHLKKLHVDDPDLGFNHWEG